MTGEFCLLESLLSTSTGKFFRIHVPLLRIPYDQHPENSGVL